MTAEMNEIGPNTSELTAVEKDRLTAYANRVGRDYKKVEGITLEQQQGTAAQAVLDRYVENGLNVNVKTPSRVERIARGIVQEVSSLTPEKIAKIAQNAAISYVKNINPANLVRENWY